GLGGGAVVAEPLEGGGDRVEGGARAAELGDGGRGGGRGPGAVLRGHLGAGEGELGRPVLDASTVGAAAARHDVPQRLVRARVVVAVQVVGVDAGEVDPEVVGVRGDLVDRADQRLHLHPDRLRQRVAGVRLLEYDGGGLADG